jgi:hypothetical protein
VQTPSGSRLDLQVARRGSDLELTWNRKADVVQADAQGTLRINDNGFRSEIHLDADQLRNGRILYVPRSGDVEASLEVRPPVGAAVSDNLRVLQPGFGGTGSIATPAPSTQAPLGTTPPASGTAQRSSPNAAVHRKR